jgi:hypothetical protein
MLHPLVSPAVSAFTSKEHFASVPRDAMAGKTIG